MAIELANLSVIDPDIRAELEMVGGAGLLARLIEMFFDDSKRLLASIDQAISSGDSTVVAQAAHRLKGGAAAVGAQRVAAVAMELEQASRESSLADARAMMDMELAALRAASQD